MLAACASEALTNGAKMLLVNINFAMMFVAAPGLIRSIWRLKAPKPAFQTASITPVGPADSM